MRNSFKPGSVFRCDKDNHGGSFNFIIIGKSDRRGYFRCRLEYDNPKYPSHGIEQDYSSTHLKRYGKQINPPTREDEG